MGKTLTTILKDISGLQNIFLKTYRTHKKTLLNLWEKWIVNMMREKWNCCLETVCIFVARTRFICDFRNGIIYMPNMQEMVAELFQAKCLAIKYQSSYMYTTRKRERPTNLLITFTVIQNSVENIITVNYEEKFKHCNSMICINRS